VYLADYGLSYRYCPNGNHKQYQENPRKGHNGTLEFTSLDAHRGVALSRRSDLEILGYCMLRWLCGRLPWDRNLDDPVAVQTAKTNLLDELPESVLKWAPSRSSCSYDEKPNYQMLKDILNPSGISLGLLEFSTSGRSINVPTPNNQKVDLQKVATQQVKQMQNRLKEKKPHRERNTESCATWRKVQNEKLIGSFDNEVTQEITRKRQKYCQPQEFLNEAKSSTQNSSYTQCLNSFYELHQDLISPHKFHKSRSPSWDTYTSTTAMDTTELESSTGFWHNISQFSLSEETKAEVSCYGFIILCLLTLVCLALYFL
ncbi:Serine/threonine-protein kinase VRK2, partial [Galemys pyrenaicus]